MNGYEYWGGFYFWWVFPLVMMVFCFLFMRGCGRRMRWSGPFWSKEGSPMDILDKRYARGEIDQQEYDERRKVLNGAGELTN